MASLGFTITQVSQNVANNTSNVTIELTLYSTNKDWNNYTSGSQAPTGTIIIDGVSRTFTHTFDLRNKTSQAIYTTNVNIAHGSDGTKTLNVSATFNGKTTYTTNLSTSASKALTKINRGSGSLRVVVEQGTQSIANNATNITTRVYLDTTQYVSASMSNAAGSATIDGTKYDFTYSGAIAANKTYEVFTKAQTIQHNEDGSRSVKAKATLATGTYLGSLNAPEITKVLSKINRGTASLRVVITQDSQSIVDNKSTVTATVYMDTTETVRAQITGGAGTLTLDGTAYTFNNVSINATGNKSYTVFKKTITVSHNASGVKSVKGSATFNTKTFLGNLSASEVTKALTQIPRPTQPTTNKSTYSFGENIVISLPRNVSSVTHTIQAGVNGKKNWTDIATSVGTSYTWAFPKTWAQWLTDSSDKLRIRAISYSGGTQLGIKEVSPSLTITTTSDMKPSIAITHSDVNTAVYNKFGGYVVGKSKIKMRVVTTLYQGTTIKTGSASLGALNKSFTTTPYELTAGNNVDALSTTLKANVTDARGLSDSKTATVTAFNYTLPQVSKLVVSRCNSDGSANDEGDHAKVTYSASVNPVNGSRNDKALRLEYKKHSESNWTVVTLPMATYTVTNQTYIVPADTEYAYDFKIVVTDYFTSSVLTKSLSSAYVLMDFHTSGRGIAFGKVAELVNRLDSALTALFRNGLTSTNGNMTISNEDVIDTSETLWFSNKKTETGPANSRIRAYNVNQNGQNLEIHAGGNLVAGGGEYSGNRISEGLVSQTGEDTYIGADGTVYIESGAQTVANAKRFEFATNGELKTPLNWITTNNTRINTGDATTDVIGLWGNSGNKVGVSVTNNQDNKRFAILGKENRIQLYNYTDAQVLWDIYPNSLLASGGDMGQSSVSVPNAAWTEVGSCDLDVGWYIVMVSGSFANNGTGFRRLGLNTVSAAEGGGWGWNDTQNAVAGAPTVCQAQGILNVTTARTYYLNAYQNSGGALTISPRWHCVKIR